MKAIRSRNSDDRLIILLNEVNSILFNDFYYHEVLNWVVIIIKIALKMFREIYCFFTRYIYADEESKLFRKLFYKT